MTHIHYDRHAAEANARRAKQAIFDAARPTFGRRRRRILSEPFWFWVLVAIAFGAFIGVIL